MFGSSQDNASHQAALPKQYSFITDGKKTAKSNIQFSKHQFTKDTTGYIHEFKNVFFLNLKLMLKLNLAD